MEKEDKKKTKREHLPPLTTGIPPWHSLAFVTTMLPVSIPFLPSLEELDALSVPAVWTNRNFPELVSLRGMAIIRLGIAGIALGLTLYLALIDPGWDVHPNYKARSKLRRATIRLQGIGTLCPFTSWCWLILGLGFLCRGIIALAAAQVETAAAEASIEPEWAVSVLNNHYLLRAALILWEITGPFAILTSTVIKYVIWPEAIKGGKPHKLAGPRNQLQHNCNSIVALLEATLLGGIPVQLSHLSMATLIGIIYVFFLWTMAVVYFGDRNVGPQYIYWFFDTTLGQTTTIAIVGLTLALTFFFILFSVVVGTVLGGSNDGSSSPPSLVLNVAFLAIATHLVCRFKK